MIREALDHEKRKFNDYTEEAPHEMVAATVGHVKALESALKYYTTIKEKEARARQNTRFSVWTADKDLIRRPGKQVRLVDFKGVCQHGFQKRYGAQLIHDLNVAGLISTSIPLRSTTERHTNFTDTNGNTVQVNTGEYGDCYVGRRMTYKAINHFRELLNRIQGQRRGVTDKGPSLSIPDGERAKVIAEIQKRRLKEPTLKQIRECMRITGNNKYYGDTYSIWAEINNRSLPSFNSSQQRILCKMFKMVHTAYKEVKPKHRKNFLSYTYTLFKLCELLEYDAVLPLIFLLKSDEKLKAHDEVWKHICDFYKWEFIPTTRIASRGGSTGDD